MATTLAVLVWTVVALVVLVSLGLNLVGLFGNWLIFGAMAGVWIFYGFVPFGLLGLGGMLAFAVLGEVLETVLAGYGASRFGGSRGAMVAALVGCILGAIAGTPLFPVVGTLVGACAGAFVAAALYEFLQNDAGLNRALWVGTGALVGKIGGIIAKFSCGLAILAVAWATF
ncbi:MAG: DUF456 family protein [Candidatus Hydrogenedens sp.]|nr:DUF456 family protein [Candidatus Hydrogenedens sp.]